jgi:hypothetical protein
MLGNDLPTATEIESSLEPKQPGKSAAARLASFIIYLITGMGVTVIILLIFLYG